MNKQIDGLEKIIEQALAEMPEAGQWQQKFIKILFATILIMQGKINFSSLSRHSHLSRKTFRRGFRRNFSFERFNIGCIEQRPVKGQLVAAIDASFVKKSGKYTEGLGYFFNGCMGKLMRGLEVSEVALIDCESRQAYSFSARQTVDVAEQSRMTHYANHLKDCAQYLPAEVKYLLADGYYTKHDFVETVCDLGLNIIGKLRCDANLKHLYTGNYQGLGRPRKYAGKVDLSDLSSFEYEGLLEKNFFIYIQQFYHVSLKRNVKVVLVFNKKQSSYILLFSTDLSLSGLEIIKLYKLRFQIEFLFRDAKQFTGLTDCQARDSKAINFHFNAAFSAVNIAKLDLQIQHQKRQNLHTSFVFSLASYIRQNYSHRLLNRLLSNLDLDLSSPKVFHAFNNALNIGFCRV